MKLGCVLAANGTGCMSTAPASSRPWLGTPSEFGKALEDIGIWLRFRGRAMRDR
jgi:hypothetical protein